MAKFTPWFSKYTNPVHVGIYPSSLAPNDDPRYSTRLHWDGRRWIWPNSKEKAINQQRYWCGLAKKPEQA